MMANESLEPVIEIAAVGNEILLGITTNTNATFISEQLSSIGYRVHRHSVLPDHSSTLKMAFKEMLARSSVVICTGGLGPTCDDLTKQIAAEVFNSPLLFRQEIADDLIKRYGYAFATLQDQATVPEKALVLKNSLGTAYGLVFQENGSTLILLPGVPVEMKAMLTEQVIPFLIKTFPLQNKPCTSLIYLCNLPESAVDPLLRELIEEYPALNFGIYPALGWLTVAVTCYGKDRDEAEKRIQPAREKIAARFSSHIFEAPSGKIEEAIQLLMVEKKLTLSTAESCTGGAISSALCRFPGASNFFLGSVVAYSNAMKSGILNVKEDTLKEHGAVSEKTVKEMLLGIFNLTRSDYAIAVTGIAGPSGGSVEKPVGTVWAAVGQIHQRPHVWKLQVKGNREIIIQFSVTIILGTLYQMIKQQHNP